MRHDKRRADSESRLPSSTSTSTSTWISTEVEARSDELKTQSQSSIKLGVVHSAHTTIRKINLIGV